MGKRIKRKARNIVTKERMLMAEQKEKRKRDGADGVGGRSGEGDKKVKYGAALSVFGKQKKATRSKGATGQVTSR